MEIGQHWIQAMKKIFKGQIINGEIKLYNERGFDLLRWSLNNKKIELTLGKPEKPRSGQQNRYLHGIVMTLISEATGYTLEEAKEIVRAKFLSYELKVGDEIVTVGRSTASLNTKEFNLLVKQCQKWGAEDLDIYIPDPEEVEL